MAFTGTPVVHLVSEGMVRVTGVSLASGASGTISLSGGTGEVKLPAQFAPKTYAIEGSTVALADQVDCTNKPATAVTTSIPITTAKTGTTPADFLITLTNAHGSLTSPGLELYIRDHT